MDRARTVEAKFNKTQAATPSPWAQWSQQAAAAARQEARMWLQNGYLDGAFCKVNSTVATAPPGVLKSRYAFNGAIKQALITAGAPIGVAQEWDGAFKTAWESWAAQVTIPGLPWYPTFAAWPGPSAPPTPNPPTPLSALVSPKASVLSPSNLANAIQAKLAGQASESSAKTAITSFANDFAGRFGQCLAGCMVVNVMGSGKVPTYSTRTAPAGPVSGTCSGGTITVTGF
jgi:hypothetical protein